MKKGGKKGEGEEGITHCCSIFPSLLSPCPWEEIFFRCPKLLKGASLVPLPPCLERDRGIEDDFSLHENRRGRGGFFSLSPFGVFFVPLHSFSPWIYPHLSPLLFFAPSLPDRWRSRNSKTLHICKSPHGGKKGEQTAALHTYSTLKKSRIQKRGTGKYVTVRSMYWGGKQWSQRNVRITVAPLSKFNSCSHPTRIH